jgi:hypothetical protein
LQNNRIVRICSSNIDDLTNAIYGTQLEGDVLDSSGLETLDDLDCFLGGGTPSATQKVSIGRPSSVLVSCRRGN